MELPEFHVFQRDTGTGTNTQAVTGIHKGIGRRGIDTAGTTSSKQYGFSVENVNVAAFHFHYGYADYIAVFVTNQIQGSPFNEELGVGAHVLLVQRVQHSVTGTVGNGTSAFYRAFTVFCGVAAEWALVDFAAFYAVKRHTHVFQFDNGFRGTTGHEFDGILVTQPVGTFHGIVHVPSPVVFLHITQRSGNTTLRCHSMRASRENFRQYSSIQTCFRQLQCGAQTSTAAAYDYGVKLSNRKTHHYPQITLNEYTAQPTNHTMVAHCRNRRKPKGLI